MIKRIIFMTMFFQYAWFLYCVAGIEHNGNMWIISENSLKVEFDEATFSIDVTRNGGNKWEMDRNLRGNEIEINENFYSFANALQKEFKEYQIDNKTGIQVILKGFPGAADVEIVVYVYIAGQRDEFVVEVEPTHDPNMVIGNCQYPRGFRIKNSWGNSLVNPSGSGGFGSLTNLNNGKSLEDVKVYAHGELYMAWWGLLRDYDRDGRKGEGFIAMVATPYDFTLNSYVENGYTTVYTKWLPSLLRLRYKRRICYDFFTANCDYVVLCDRYRKFLIDEGRYKTYDDKLKINPNVKKLKGIVQFTRYITQCHGPDDRSFYHDFYSARNHSERFINRFNNPPHFFIHIREWHEGELSEGGTPYDLNVNGPNITAGGWDGFKALSDWCEQTDNFLYLYDTYNDIAITPDLSIYNTDLVIKTQSDRIWTHNWWCGSYRFATICPVKRMELFKHNLQVLKNHGINIKAIYLDITVIREPLECYNTEHDHGVYGDALTGHLGKADYCRAIEDFYTWCATEGIIVLSEHPVEWAWPFVLGSFFMTPKRSKVADGEYVPLLHLVAHDAITGGDYVDTYHTGSDPKLFLHHLLHGLFPIPRENIGTDARWAEIISNLHQKIGFERMVNHEFVDGMDYIQKTTFANGVVVEVNYNTGEYTIDGSTTLPPDIIPPYAPKNVEISQIQ